MAKEWAQSFYKGTTWQQCRNAYMRSVNSLCEECRKKGLVVPAEIVHHKIPITRTNINDPEITLSFRNLEALCRECHAIKHGMKEENVKRYKIVDGKLVY